MVGNIITIAIATICLGWVLFDGRRKNFYQHLFQLEEVLDGGLDFIQLSRSVLVKVIKELQATAGIIYWFDQAQSEFKLRSLVGIPTEKVNQIIRSLRQSKGVLDYLQVRTDGYTVKLNRPQSIPPDLKNLQELAKIYRGLIVIPLSIQKNINGALILFKSTDFFTKRHYQLLTIFAPRAAVRLENARLYQLAKETSLENAKLYIHISKLYQKATLDEITGLYNRNYLMQRIKEEIKKAWRLKQPLSLIFTDLDFFKKVNDEHGHQLGDQLLAEFGALVKGSIREYDVACRFGGEEFIILLPQTKQGNAADLAERLREKIAGYHFCTGLDLKITASFGVSSLPEAEINGHLAEEVVANITEEMIAWADDALYQAKKSGRNRVVAHPVESPPQAAPVASAP
ncbi:MAG TPA: sensor domain-containing diguanylate cyclase [Bacillota bacterium]|nr:sensor domain-containing diguanylate cyclase [Bacillota bacterium]